MQKENLFQRALNWVERRGFYMILGLCVAAIGVSAYVLFFTQPEPEPILGELQLQEPQADAVSPSADVVIPVEPDREPETEPEHPVQTPAESVQTALREETPTGAPVEPESEPEPEPVIQVDRQETVRQPVFTFPIQSGQVQREFSGDSLVLDPTMGDWRTHNGVDFVCDPGDAVMAVLDGVVAEIGEDALLGCCIRIDHGAGLESRYCGLAVEDSLKTGMQVTAGQTIGRAAAGNLAESAQESHLHLEMTEDGRYVDPMSVLK